MKQDIETRPWGTYEVLLDAENVKVKRIIVNPNQRLSYQYHHKRREQWTCIEGTLSIVLNGATVEIEPGNSIHIPLGSHHRAWNRTNEPVKDFYDGAFRLAIEMQKSLVVNTFVGIKKLNPPTGIFTYLPGKIQ